MAKAKKKIKKRKVKPDEMRRTVLITVKVTEAEARLLYRRADQLAAGNVSRFIRHAIKLCKTKAIEKPAKKPA